MSEAFMFFQAPCVVPYKYMTNRRVQGLFIGCVAIFLYFFTQVYFDYIRCVQENKYVDWDVKTVTAGDYTVEFAVSSDQYDYFVAHYLKEELPLNEISQFRLYVKDEMEKRMTVLPLDMDGIERGEQVKIAKISFAFDNAKVIKWLKKRGGYIKKEKWDKVDEVNDEIRFALKKDQELLD